MAKEINKRNTIYMVAVMQSYIEGKTIEVSDKPKEENMLSAWRVDPSPEWDWLNKNYRVSQFDSLKEVCQELKLKKAIQDCMVRNEKQLKTVKEWN